jgi:hypothetical protein
MYSQITSSAQGDVAQSGERGPVKTEVAGSKPVITAGRTQIGKAKLLSGVVYGFKSHRPNLAPLAQPGRASRLHRDCRGFKSLREYV